MTYSNAVWRAWILHHAFAGLGFSSDDVFVEFGRDAAHQELGPCAWVVLKAQGLTFTLSVGPVEKEKFAVEWMDFITSLKSISEEELEAAWESRDELFNTPGFAAKLTEGLLRKGFSLPAVQRKKN